MIEGTDNVVLIPKRKHHEITRWYQTKSDDFGGVMPRDYLRGKGWEERRRVGLRMMIEVGALKP